jgi:hypothetical protein
MKVTNEKNGTLLQSEEEMRERLKEIEGKKGTRNENIK